MSKKFDMTRICFLVGCFLYAVVNCQAQAACGAARCVSYNGDALESVDPDSSEFDGFEELQNIFDESDIDQSCGASCVDPYTCENYEACFANRDADTCGSCIDAVIEYLNSTDATDECGQYSGCLSWNEIRNVKIMFAIYAQKFPNFEDPCCVEEDDDEDDDGEGDLCFSSVATTDVENKGKTLVKDIKVGDRVLTRGNQYKPVYTVDHMDPNKWATFLQIYSTANAESPLELTESHMVFVHGKASPIPASAIKVGDALQTANSDSPSIVTKISSVERKGIWNPITADGTIWVDGIVASNYNVLFRANDDGDVEVAGAKVMSHHDFLHLLMTPYRAVCLGLSLSFCETKHEFNGYSQLGNHILQFFHQQSGAAQDTIIFVFVLIAFVFQLLSLAMNPLVAIGLFLGSGSYYFFAKKNKLHA
jgi:hypothetical protein